MARIRTIKPEFPQSESMGRVSRDARLLFVMLWTLCDDSGRTRANSRMLASLLFPYDDDASGFMDGWLNELEEEGCIVRYSVEGNTYLQVCKWLNHQKIDKPSASKIPEFAESSRILANVLEVSSEDQGSRIKDQGEEAAKKPRQKNTSITFKTWLDSVPEGASAVPEDHEVFEYSKSVGIPSEFLDLAWTYFERKYSKSAKRYTATGWAGVFQDSVAGNWGRIWWIEPDGSYKLTTVGIQLQRVATAEAQEHAA